MMRLNKSKKNLTYKIEFDEQAVLDIKEILFYLEWRKSTQKIIHKTELKIKNKILSLSYFPMRFKIHKKEKNRIVRMTYIDNYNIYYHVNNKNNSVRILRVTNAKMLQVRI